MTSHKLAKLLSTLPDLPIAVSAHGHHYSSQTDKMSHGPLMIGRGSLGYSANQHIIIGDMLGQYQEDYVEEILFSGGLPKLRVNIDS